MSNAARVRDRLRAAAFIFGARDTILRPDFHRDADDVVSLFAQKVPRHAGIDPAAHPEEDAFFHSALR